MQTLEIGWMDVANDPVQRLQAVLDQMHPGLRIIRTTQSGATAESAAAAIGCQPGQIVKSLVFAADDRPLLLLVAGDRRADPALIAPLLGLPRKRLRMATAAEVLAFSGFAIGGVPPFGHPQPLETLIDESFDRYDEVVAAAGSPFALFRAGRDLLVQLTGGRVAAISVPVRA